MQYSYDELEFIDRKYDEQLTYKEIAEQCNQQFHNGQTIRTVKSIDYALDKIYSDPRCLDLE